MKKVLLRTISLITFAAVLLSTISASSKNISEKDFHKEEKLVKDNTYIRQTQKFGTIIHKLVPNSDKAILTKTQEIENNSAQKIFSVPVFSNCPSNISVSNSQDQCGQIVNFTTPTATAQPTTYTQTFYYGSNEVGYFTVPANVTSLTIRAVGAPGGFRGTTSVALAGGKGAAVQGDFTVTPGQNIYYLIGQRGGSYTSTTTGGGGGGATWVSTENSFSTKNSLLLVAAGGGGAASSTALGDASSVADGNIIITANNGAQHGITNYTPGDGGQFSYTQGGAQGSGGQNGGAGGAGFSYNGGDDIGGPVLGTGGIKPSLSLPPNSGIPSQSYSTSSTTLGGLGGFGGGGSASYAGGGGGGFNGGGGGSKSTLSTSAGSFGGGGGSYNGGVNQVNEKGVSVSGTGQSNNGWITFTWTVGTPVTVTQTTGLPSGSLFPIGTTINTFVADDGAGNTATCSFTVTVTDNQNPTITAPQDVVVNVDPNSCSATNVSLGSPNASDNCPNVSVTNNAPTNFPIGNTTVTWTATDASGNKSTATQTITVVDNIPPTIVCPGTNGNITATANTVVLGQSGAMVVFSATGSDNCGTPTITYSQNSGTFFPVGTTTVTVTADDGHGNITSCSFDVIVSCSVPTPTISTSGPTSFSPGGSVTLTSSSTSNNLWSTGETTQSITVNTAGSYTVTVSTGSCSATSAATAVIINQNPATALNFDGVDDKVTVNNSTLGNFGNNDFTVEMSVRTSLSSGVEYLVSKRNSCGGDNFFSLQIVDGKLNMEMAQNASAPTYYVALIGHTFISDGNWHHVALTRQMGNVNIYVDGVLEATSNATIANINNSYALEFGSSVCNGQNGSVKFKGDMDEIRIWSRALCTEELDHYRHCELTLPQTGLQAYYQLNAGYLNANNAGITTAVDATGNGNNATLNNFGLTGTTSNWVAGTVSGTCTPFATGAASITGTNTICVGATTQLSASPSGGTWVSSNSTIASVSNSGLVTGNNPGSATITYTSLCGAVATTTITVNAKVTPTFTQVAAICAGTTLSALPTTSTDGITGTWSPALNNTTTTTYTFTPDAGQCANTATMTITVNPLPAATITAENNIVTTCPGQFVTLHANVAPGYTYQWQKNGADISGETDKDLHPSASGNYTVVITNSSNCVSAPSNSITVTIEDVTAPVTPTLSDITGECSATAPVAATTDACAGTITGTTNDPLTYNTQGDHVIHWTFTDPSGNSTTADQHVIITDVTPPTVVCPGNISTTANTVVSGQSGAMVSFSATASDNCGTPTITYSQNPGTFFPVGTTTVTVTADDGHGHTATCTFDVTVTCSVATPTISAGGPTSFCPGGSVTLTSSSATGNVWSTGATTQSITVSATGTYSVTVNDGSCSAVSAGTTVTAQDVTAPVTPTLSDVTGECSATAPVATTTDACAGTITGTTSDPLTYNTQGDHVIHWTFTDPSGNSTTADQHVIITDVTPPTVVCPGNISTTANTVVSGQSGAMVSFSATASDNCGTPTITYSQNPGTFFPTGTTTVTVTADDGHGHTATCTFDVVVNCVTPVFTTCPSDISKSTDAGVCGAVVNYVSTASGDPATTYSYAFTGATTGSGNGTGTGSVFNTGVTTVTVTASNICGNATCSFTVTVTDTEKPVITGTPSTINKTNDAGNCGAVVTWSALSAADNCAVVSFTSDHHSGDVFPVGTTTVTYTATDAAGNTTTTHFDIVVTDNENPVITVPSDVTHTADAGLCSFTFGTGNQTLAAPGGNGSVHGYDGLAFVYATATDNCGVTVTGVRDDGQPLDAAYPVGVTTITWTATDIHGHTVSGTQKITITDDENPVIVGLPGNISQSNDAGQCGAVVNWTAATATDNCPGVMIASDHHSGDLFPIGNTTVTYTATDAHGHTVTGSFTVTVTDTQKPVITGTPSTINKTNDAGACGAVVTWSAPAASDNCSVVSFTSDHHSGDVFPVGTTTVTYTATDAGGNTTTTHFDVVVTDNEVPVVTCPSGVTVTANTTESSVNGAHVTYGAATATDNCGVQSIVYSMPSGGFFPVGDNVVDVTVTDIHGNVNHCSFHVVVNCVTPVFTTCPSDISKSTDAGVCGAVVNYVSTASGDPATTYSYAFTGATTGSGNGTGTGSIFNTGVTTVTVTASNICGNATCSFTVTVTDTEKPVITGTPSTINKTNDAGTCGAVVTWSVPAASDNCSVASFTSDHHSGDVFPVGTTTVTYTATDAAGNTSSSSFDVVVADNEVPVVTCPSGITVTANTTESSVNGAHVTYGAATATDNCGVQSIVYSMPSGGFFPVGDNVVDVTVTDIHGNVNHCSFHVVVNCVTPVFTTCPSDISKSTDAGVCGAVVNYVSTASGDPATTYSYAFTGATTGSGNGTGTGSVFNTGVTTVIVTASNICGNATCSFTVTVTDTEKPVITGTPSTINKTNDAGACGAVVTWSVPSASDNCSVASFTSDHHSGDVFPVGTTTVTYTATDAAGNTSSSSFDVVVADNEVPVVTCPSGITVTANTTESSVNGAHVTYGAATATDNCGVQSIVYSMPSGSFFPVGDNVVDVTVTDIHGNVSHCSFHVVVNCVTPVFTTCPSDISKSTDAGICGAVVNYVSTASGDPATTYSYAFTGATTGSGNGTGTGSVFNTGVTTVTVTASNICGNATCSFTVTVTDTEKPVITGTPSTINKTNDAGNCGAVVTWSALSAADNCSVVSFTSDHHSGDVFPVGTTTVTYTATDAAGNTTTTHFDIVVTDNENPVITVPSDVTHTADAGLCSFTFGTGNQTLAAPGGNGSVHGYDGLAFVYATATDNCGVTVTGVRDDGQPLDAAYPVGVTTITWTATDIHGHSVSGDQKITITDDENPVIVGLPGNISQSNDAGQCGAVVNWTAVTATDNCPGVTIASDHHSGDLFPIGNTTVTYTATDAHGHTVTASFIVTVNDTEKPKVKAPGMYGVVSEPGKCGATIANIGQPQVSDNCGIASVTNDHPSGFYPVGTTTVTWIVTDVHGNVTDTAKQLISVIDNEKPTITAPASITVNNDPGTCGATLSIGTAVAADNCGVFSVTNDHPSNYYPVGTTIVTWTVLDIHGFKSKATQTITVIDNEPPVITVPTDVTHTADAGLCSFSFDAGASIQTAPGGNGAGIGNAGVSLGVATATDNCAVTVTGVRDDGQPLDAAYPVGVTTITWTATDIHGNAVSGTQKVTITDDEYPVIVGLPANINKGNDLNTCGAVVNWTAATATDNCPGVNIVSDHHSGDVFPLGTTLVTYTATDAHGHSVTGNFSVTVSDVQKPVVQCPADITVNASTTNNGQPGANVTFAATASDNCGVPVISYSVPSGSFFPVGTTTVTTTVDDGHGNTATCSFNVTVNCVPPVITVSSVPTSNTFTGGVPTSLYLGYGAQSTVLKTTVAGGGNYSYAWSGSGAAGLNSTTGSAPLFTPTEAGSYQFTVVATNGVGCQSSGTISICVTDIRVPGNMSSDDDDKVDDHASCDHKTHSAKDCPHKYEKDNKCDHKSHNDKDCPYKKSDKDDHKKYDDKNYKDNSKTYSSKSGTKEHDDKDDHQVTCDHKAHSAWNCPHRYEKDNKCDHKAHSEKDCPYKDKKDDKDDHHATCDHKAHSAKDCPHRYEKDNKCDHKSHSEKDCPYKDKDDHDDHHEGDGEHGQDNYKVFICHVPPGNPSQHITLSISINAVAAHLANHPGDRLGSCEQAPCSGYTDLEKPVVSCPPAITVDCSSSMVPSVTGKATATDNSGVVSVTYTDTDNQGSDATAANYYNYTITRTWKATDPAGNSSECSQLITVRDQVKPIINCPGNVTLTCAGDMGTATAGTATATDNSNGPVTITYSDRNSGDGIYRTWTATDASGNYATCTQKITVRDDVKPVITAPADVTAQCGTSTSPSVTGTAVATDNCNLATVTYSDYIKYNVITRTWKATDASGNYSTDVQKITIVDNVKPVITAPADKSISCGASTEPKYCGGYATGTDGCSDVTISYSDAMSGNVIVRTWKATDASGNYSTAVQNITIIDNVKPVITDPKDYTISCGASTEPKYCGGSATATDNCSTPVVTYSDVTVGNVITRTWKATDAAGNYSTSTQKITIVDNTKPVITDVPDITVSCNGSTAPSATGTATATDACSDVTVTYSDVVSGNKITRTWKATDAAGNYSTSVQTITQGAAFDVDITSVPTSSTYTGGVPTNLYLGYGAQSTMLQTNSLPSGGAPYTYNWSGSYVNKLSNSHSAAPVFTPSTFGYYTFSVQVTNKYGCTSTQSISICVTDIRVPGCNGAKVYVCHTTSGKYGKQQTLEVPLNQVSSHIGSGYNSCGGSGNDRLGSCDQSPCNITSANSIVSNSSTFTKEGGSETVTTEEDLNVVAMPNPSTTYFTLKVTSRNKEEINMRVLDAGGRVIDAKSKIVPNSTLQIGQNYSSGTYYAELIQGTRRKVVQLIKGRG